MDILPQGERIASLETLTQSIKEDVATVKRDVAALNDKFDTRGEDAAKQFQDLKDILLAQNVASKTRAHIRDVIQSKAGWVVTQLVIVGAALIGANVWHFYH